MIVWSIVGVFVLLVACAAWIGVRAWIAKGELEAAVPLATTIQSQFGAGKADDAKASTDQLVQHAAAAARLTGDPIWRAAEIIPGLGANLVAMRQAAEITDSVASDAIDPLVTNISNIGVDSFQPVNGAINLAPLSAAQPTVASAKTTLDAAATKAAAIDTSGTISQLTDAVGKLQSSVLKADQLIDGVNNAVTLLPKMLGADGPRNYLLLFQNPAEVRAGGGITSALALVGTNNGAVSLTQQASGSSFPKYAQPVVTLPEDTRGLYGDRATTYVQNTTLMPEFDQSGQVASAMWADRFGTTVDGVVSFDPVALSYLLEATGPVTLPTGEKLTSANAVKFLLSDVYANHPDPSVQDAVFAGAAKAVFDRVSQGDIDPGKLLDALVRAGNENRFKVWSSRDDEQQVLAGTTLAGALPPVTADSTGLGVYFNDATGAKMDYYLDSSVKAISASCRADGRPEFQVAVTLTNTAPADAATSLPAYVTGGGGYGVTPGNVKTLVYVYGPQSTGEMKDAAVVLSADAGIAGGTFRTAPDQNHIAVEFPVELAPGESRTVTATFLGQVGNSVNITPQITPGVNPTVYADEINGSFSDCENR